MGGGSNSAERAAQEVSLAVDFGARLNFTSLNRPVVRWPASALVHITDSSRTSSEVRKPAHNRKSTLLFDHLVGATEQRWWNG
jgi:hypothetical protein